MTNQNIKEVLAMTDVQKLFEIFDKNQIYLVGGCVRNAFSNRDVKDIDFASTLEPEQVIRVLNKNKIKFLDIGKEHGTITAIINNTKYEITSCRSDIKTDGRHAVVDYTSDIKVDSNRRDFTFNAIYVDQSGDTFDFHNGLKDLEKNKVQFIGDVEQRIQEDYLRILRFFRFHCEHSPDHISESELLLIKKHINGLKKVSKERLWIELKNIIEHKNSSYILKKMQDTGLFSLVFQGIIVGNSFEKLNNNLVNLNLSGTSMCKLAILLNNDEKIINSFISENPLSKIEQNNLINLSNIHSSIVSYMSMREARAALYRLGKDNFTKQVLCQWSKDLNDKTTINWRALIEVASSWSRPEFTVKASDVINMGISEGPELGEILEELEEWWINNDFIDDQFSLIERLKAICFARH